jgi:hypothetical protein
VAAQPLRAACKWEFKARHWDALLLFKMVRRAAARPGAGAPAAAALVRPGAGCSQGKFYEIFEMDAHVAADILHLNAMRARRPVPRLPVTEDLHGAPS